jgi:hypothetical protein
MCDRIGMVIDKHADQKARGRIFPEWSPDDVLRLQNNKEDLDMKSSPYARMMYKWKTKEIIAGEKMKYEPMN